MKRIELLLILLIVLVGLPVGGVWWVGAKRRERVASCAHRLYTLWKGQNVWISSRTPSRGPLSPNPTGKAFWERLVKRTPPIVDPDATDIFTCPFRIDARPGEIHFLGPATDHLMHLGRTAPVGCDERDNHGEGGGRGGNVLRKTGDVLETTGAEWDRIHRNRLCIP